MKDLEGKTILLAVTGGIAAYKSCEIVRGLKNRGADVRVAMTKAATQFVTPLTFETLSGHPVALDMFTGKMDHLALTRGCDLMLIAPATADILAKIANGIADDIVCCAALARSCPLAAAPAMNTNMYAAAATQRNLQTLRNDGVTLIGPATGPLACGVSGAGRLAPVEQILEEVSRILSPCLLKGKRVLITAGPTVEPVDPMRIITNRSSGKQGWAVARAARRAGAEVTLVAGPTALADPFAVNTIRVQTARQMFEAVQQHAPQSDIFISVAAVADWCVTNPAAGKLKKENGAPQLEFSPNPDILATVAREKKHLYCVGFAAETGDPVEYARGKLLKKHLDLIAANNLTRAAGQDENEVTLLSADGRQVRIGPADKDTVAAKLIEFIALETAASSGEHHA